VRGVIASTDGITRQNANCTNKPIRQAGPADDVVGLRTRHGCPGAPRCCPVSLDPSRVHGKQDRPGRPIGNRECESCFRLKISSPGKLVELIRERKSLSGRFHSAEKSGACRVHHRLRVCGADPRAFQENIEQPYAGTGKSCRVPIGTKRTLSPFPAPTLPRREMKIIFR